MTETETTEGPDPHDERLFPLLTDDQRAAIADYADARSFAVGDVLFEQGVTDAPFIVLTSGRVEFFDRQPDGDRFINTLLPGTFIGDVAIFTGEPTIAACVAAEPSEALLMSRDDLRRLTADRPHVADLVLSTMSTRREWLEGHGYGQARVFGHRTSAAAFAVRDLLGRNSVPHRWVDVDADRDDAALLSSLGVGPDDLPVLVDSTAVLHRPSVDEVALHFGLRTTIEDVLHDVAVVGAGPAGLGAAVYGASEGLRTVVLDAFAPGGQAGTSSRIENYLGFPTGVSGTDLTRRATLQARRLGAVLSSAHEVSAVRPGDEGFVLDLSDGQHARARVVVVATGARYRRLDVPDIDRFDGAGVYYAASHTEAIQCAGEEVVVIGGGNSAGQAALHLARYADRVHLLIRRDDLRATMSAYLVDRVERSERVTVHTGTELTEVHGDQGLDAVTITSEGASDRIDTHAVFVMIGAIARSEAVADLVELDRNGFVLTGPDAEGRLGEQGRPDERHLLETTTRGVLAVGDIRCGSVKRVATAVGDGAMAVRFVHDLLGESP